MMDRPLVPALFLAALVAVLSFASPAAAQFGAERPTSYNDGGGATLPDGFYLETVAPGDDFTAPVEVAFAPDGRIFVVEKSGRLYIVENDQRVAEPFLDIRDEVMRPGDRGLLGFALDPDFATNGHVYLSYVVDTGVEPDIDSTRTFSRVTRYTASSENPNRADPDSRRVLIGETFRTGIPACYNSHAIGTLAFGADGTLFVGSGDAASWRSDQADAGGLYPSCFGEDRVDPYEDIGAYRSQYLGSMAGKVLRVDPETGLGLPSNPWWTGDGADNASRVWAMGLRNPFRFSVDQATGSADPAAGDPGTLFIGDVGWYRWEELNVSRGGENFGWPCFEGDAREPTYANMVPAHSDCQGLDQDPPVYNWYHWNPDGSNPPGLEGLAIVAGDVYGGTTYPARYRGRLFYGDYVKGWIASAVPAASGLMEHEVFTLSAGPIVSIRYDAITESLYWIDIVENKIYRLAYAGGDTNSSPVASFETSPPSGSDYLTLSFDASESYDPDGSALSYTWDFGDGSTSNQLSPTHQYPAPGPYRVTLVVTDTEGASARYAESVIVGSAPPEITSVSPRDGMTAFMGESVLLSAEAVDPEGETLTYSWDVRLIHDIHEHPDVFQAVGQEVLFDVPEHGSPGEYIAYRVVLTVQDPLGLSATRAFVVNAEYRHDLEIGWHTRELGGVPRGGVEQEGSGFRLVGGGLAPTPRRDYVRFVYQDLVGDGSFEAHVDDLIGPASSVAGLMMRQDLLPSSAHVFASWTPGGVQVDYRAAEGEERVSTPCPSTSQESKWLRLKRLHNTVDVQVSRDGTEWSSCSEVTLGEATTWFAGLAVSSRDTDFPATAVFSSVSGVRDTPLPPIPSALSIRLAYPNPTSSALSLVTAWPTSDPAQIVVIDMLGRRVRTLQTAPTRAGESTVLLDVSGLPAGPYVVQVIQGTRTDQARISVL